MSYGLIGMGAAAVAAGSCGVHSARNPVSGVCECDSGYSWVDPDSTTNYDCKPIDISKPCKYPGQQRSPIDLRCVCPPGSWVPSGASGTQCVPIRSYFPSCKDATGKSVPNCILGMPLKETAIAAGAGALLGLIVGRLLG